MADAPASHRQHFWERAHADSGEDGRPPAPGGADLAALRRGIGKEPGTVPQLWPFYTTLSFDGRLSHALRAEHVALTLFAVHQQSQRLSVHQRGAGLGQAARRLRDSGKFSPEAVDRRFAAAATATSIAELAVHLRGLVAQMRSLNPPPSLDYTALFRDLRQWQRPDLAPRVRRRWGSDYFVHRQAPESGADSAGTRPTGASRSTSSHARHT